MWNRAKIVGASSSPLRSFKHNRVPETSHYQRFPLKYITNEQLITWNEIRCLCIALGYTPQSLKNVCQENLKKIDDAGVDLDTLSSACKGVEFYEAFNYAFNQHTSEWNSEAIHHAIHLLARKAITFDELYLIRTAYALCESQDGKGLKISKQHLIEFFKLCNRIISPMKLMHRIKHMSSKLKVPDRIQLSEAFHLALWCENYDHLYSLLEDFKRTHERTSIGTWKLDNLKDALQPKSARLAVLLDEECIAQEWTFESVPFTKSSELREVPLNQTIRLREEAKEAATYAPIQAALKQSQLDLVRMRADGYNHQQRPDTAPAFLHQSMSARCTVEKGKSRRASTAIQRPTTVRDWIRHFEEKERHRCDSRRGECQPISVLMSPPAHSQLSHSNDAKSGIWSSERDLTNELTEAKFSTETAEIVARKYMHEDLEYLRPGFWRRHSARDTKNESVIPTTVIERPSPRRLQNKLPLEKFPSPVHNRCCDASKPDDPKVVKSRASRLSTVTLYSFSARPSMASVY